MRRLSGITLQVEAPGRGAGRPSSARSRPMPPAARRSRWRWPGALQSALWRRLSLALLLLLAAAVGLALFPGQKVIGKALAWSARAGFRVDDIFVEGRNRTPPEQLLAALAVKRGDAIFAVDLAQARRRLEQIPWVRSATVERRLPDQIHLLISERAPIALWQSKGRYFLVDADGQIVGDQIED